jgi:hypothetical protein
MKTGDLFAQYSRQEILEAAKKSSDNLTQPNILYITLKYGSSEHKDKLVRNLIADGHLEPKPEPSAKQTFQFFTPNDNDMIATLTKEAMAKYPANYNPYEDEGIKDLLAKFS